MARLQILISVAKSGRLRVGPSTGLETSEFWRLLLIRLMQPEFEADDALSSVINIYKSTRCFLPKSPTSTYSPF
jgi:hypothetical protein